MKRAITAVLVVAAIAALVLWVPAMKNAVVTPTVVHAQNSSGGCSAASLSGAYAFAAQGTLLTSILGLPAPAPWAEVARVDFNGAGSFSAIATVNVGGAALNSIPVAGKYTVNKDCTGSFRIPLNAQDTITEAVIVIGDGQQFVLTHTESFAVVQGRGERMSNGGCSLGSLSGPYSVSRQGTLVQSVLGLPAPAPWGEVALADFDGAGGFSGTANVNIGGIAINGGFTGTYTIKPDCTGTVTVHPNPPYNALVITEAIVLMHGGQQLITTDTDSVTVVQGRAERLSSQQ